MTTENTIEATEANTQEATTEMMDVDLFGIKLNLPKEVADQVIMKRDEKVSGYNDLSEQMSQIKSKEQETLLKANESERRAQALEAAKNGEIERAKEILSTEYRDKISKYEAHSFRMAISNAIKSRDDLVDGVADDATNQIAGMAKWQLSDDFNVQDESGKSVTDIVNEFLDARPYMKLAQGNKPLGQPKTTRPPEQSKDAKADLRRGLEKLAGV